MASYHEMPVGSADHVPLSIFAPIYPGREKEWLQMATGQRRLALRRQIDENNASHARAMREYRAWRRRVYEQSLTAIRLLDLRYLPRVDHPHRRGKVAYELQLPLRDRHGDEALLAFASNVDELEEAIQQWFAALTHPTRSRENPGQYFGRILNGDEEECVRVADHYVKQIFHGDLPVEQRDALITAIFRCKWFDVPPGKLRSYFGRVMRNAAKRRFQSAPLKLGGEPAKSLDEPLPNRPGTALGDVVADPKAKPSFSEPGMELWESLWEFASSIPPSQPKLQRMARLLLELQDEEEAVLRYGRGGAAQLKRLRCRVRDWHAMRTEATG